MESDGCLNLESFLSLLCFWSQVPHKLRDWEDLPEWGGFLEEHNLERTALKEIKMRDGEPAEKVSRQETGTFNFYKTRKEAAIAKDLGFRET